MAEALDKFLAINIHEEWIISPFVEMMGVLGVALLILYFWPEDKAGRVRAIGMMYWMSFLLVFIQVVVLWYMGKIESFGHLGRIVSNNYKMGFTLIHCFVFLPACLSQLFLLSGGGKRIAVKYFTLIKAMAKVAPTGFTAVYQDRRLLTLYLVHLVSFLIRYTFPDLLGDPDLKFITVELDLYTASRLIGLFVVVYFTGLPSLFKKPVKGTGKGGESGRGNGKHIETQ